MNFLKSLKDESLKNGERAVALLWFHGVEDHSSSRTPAELASEIESAGYARQNITRLREFLSRDTKTAKDGPQRFKIRITARANLDNCYQEFLRARPIPASDSILPRDVFENSRDYTKRVVTQINASFDCGLYDCCSVMCRRLLETLIIEAFEKAGEEHLLKDNNGNFLMFSGLLAKMEASTVVTLSRNGQRGLNGFKKLGDLSAHNRRFNARLSDIDRIRDGMRVASEELLHLAGQT